MAKKKIKSTPKTTKVKSHGQLFDSHPNLKWLLPVFFIIAAVAVIALKNNSMTSETNMTTSVNSMPESSTTTNSTPSGTANTTNSTTGY